MNTAPHLRLEDRPAFERVLDEALRAVRERPAPDAGPRRPTDEQLRAAATAATAAITACAAVEYERFVRLREELRRPGNAPSAQAGAGPAGDAGGARAGLLAVLSVLAPALAGTAAVIFLLVGHLLRLLTPEPSIAAPMRGAGWAFAALAAVSLLAASVGLLVTAVRHGSGALRAEGRDGRSGPDGPDGPEGSLAEEVARARETWRAALLERGVLPFLHEVLDGAAPGPAVPPADAGAGAGPAGSAAGAAETGGSRHPRLGYTHPGFSSPAAGAARDADAGPGFSGPGHAPD
ncbi:hypothetical protein ACFSJS_05010 [Streptomyces desertarenae]|uniref:Transmembrane protein n=1 Tax=Streptomyces desertarenae TaxID=2666184 RepID=A0ABW4PFI0_9ACTN